MNFSGVFHLFLCKLKELTQDAYVDKPPSQSEKMVRKEKLFEMNCSVISYHYFRSLTEGKSPLKKEKEFSKSKPERTPGHWFKSMV